MTNKKVIKYFVDELWVYPIKSFGGIKFNSAELDLRGFVWDRRWMLVNENSEFITQRTVPELALFQTNITNNILTITKLNKPKFNLQFSVFQESSNIIASKVFKSDVWGVEVNHEISKRISKEIGFNVKLIKMPDSSKRFVDSEYSENSITGFADGFPILMFGRESLKELNRNIKIPVSVKRFRANIIFSGGKAFDEDFWKEISIGKINFSVAKKCGRCVIVDVNPKTGRNEKTVLKALSGFRMNNNKVLFGQNLIHKSTGVISIGEEIVVKN